MSDLFYTPGEDESFIELSAPSGAKLYKKHILTKGKFYYQDGEINVTDDFLDSVVKNFNDHVVSHVQVPIVDGQNRHNEDPRNNIGEVVKVEREGDKLYTYIDVRDDSVAPKMGKTFLGASAQLAMNWKNNRTGKRVGPTLIHTAITNNAHLNDLEDFQEVLAMSNDSSNKAVLLSAAPTRKDDTIMDLDEFINKGREDFDIDIPALQRAAAESSAYAKLSNELQSALTDSGILKLSASGEDGESTAEDIVAAVSSIIETNVKLSADVDTLVKESATAKAEARIDELVAGGFITPAKRDANLKLLLSNPESFEELLPEKPVVDLSSEQGQQVKDGTHDATVADEIARLSADAEANGLIRA